MDGTLVLGPQPALTSNRPEIAPESEPRPGVSEKGERPHLAVPVNEAEPQAGRLQSLIAAGKQALARSDLITARTYFSEALKLGVEEPDTALLRAELTRIGNETIFSTRVFENDPFVERYVIQPGDTLDKIAKVNNVSADLLATINQVRDKNRIRAGQTIKLIKGPFNAVIDKSDYWLDVYLGSTFVKHYRVGLGADGSTPSGEWRVGTKLINPTYYPPRGGRIVAADDPDNPLGERWIGLVGVSGEAAGQERYGLHGTIDPDSIGQSVSLGCIRMHNEDVEALYAYLIEKHSTVAVRN
ncbi:MAG: L,D-transpeptidase family protein [Phycisphaerae bacterium]